MAEREAACQLCDFLKHLVRDEVAQLEIRQVLRFAAQPPMHFRTMPLDPASDYSMVYGPTPLGHDLFQAIQTDILRGKHLIR